MIVKPTLASDYAPKQVALVRAVCLFIATKLPNRGTAPLLISFMEQSILQVFIDTLFPLPYTSHKKINYINILKRGHHES
jgi:hypothetical protein